MKGLNTADKITLIILPAILEKKKRWGDLFILLFNIVRTYMHVYRLLCTYVNIVLNLLSFEIKHLII